VSNHLPQNGCDKEINDHHCVSRSFLGSNESINISSIPVQEHNAFHKAAGYRPPDFFLRKLLLSSVHWHDQEGHFIAQGFYDDVLDVLMKDDWRTLYVSSAIKRPSGGNGQTKSAAHLQLHVYEEQNVASDAIGALAMGKYVCKETRDFVNDVMLFYQTNEPAGVMYKYLTDRNSQEDFKWVKPLLPNIHSELCTLAKRARVEYMAKENRAKLMQRLMHHRHDLVECAQSWQPSLHDSFDAIVSLAQQRMDERMARGGYQPFKQVDRSPAQE
jgi:hypothetical protein